MAAAAMSSTAPTVSAAATADRIRSPHRAGRNHSRIRFTYPSWGTAACEPRKRRRIDQVCRVAPAAFANPDTFRGAAQPAAETSVAPDSRGRGRSALRLALQQAAIDEAEDPGEDAFDDGVFDVVFSQHVQMNTADKDAMYREAYRVLDTGGLLAIWDITAAGDTAPRYPLPWADTPAQSRLVSSADLRAVLEGSGFAIDHWDDLTEQAATIMRMVLDAPPNPVGLHAFVPDFATKAEHLTSGLAAGTLRAVRGIARRS
ncbi:SAM-dependent methyltransferase [Nocardia seriolae]|uniref:SAM-dependent methyltransferase n=1 Tax=Nocardia seriolae TaxID=37332 RepID=A0ABC9Z671_9NOCA|nr:hypothetical protein NSER024013_18320 [Nocardia seriolae]GAM51123.1 SAM-dependent methyltransferase [Nocardia seriolae]GAP33091.1 SAM-dependent methyltransferase [Nocardia seriolae]GEM28694.1 hypothetical protein NS2_69330 [Nocardia seriolae NBRC 15557]